MKETIIKTTMTVVETELTDYEFNKNLSYCKVLNYLTLFTYSTLISGNIK